MTSPPLPVGAFFLRHVGGLTGRAISAMQGFVRGGSYWTHAGLILDRGQYIQGQPRGAAIYPISNLFDGQPLLVSDAPIQVALAQDRSWLANATRPDGQPHNHAVCGSCQNHEDRVRARVDAEARRLEHASYSYLDYPVLGLAELARLHPNNAALTAFAAGLRHYINHSGHLICSALVDRGYQNANVKVYDDGRMPGDVTPEDLAEYAYADGRTPLIDTRENPK
jgi:hypothetical protein